jgi:hypothetical protein
MTAPSLADRRAELREAALDFQKELVLAIWTIEHAGVLSAADYTLLRQWQELREITARAVASINRLSEIEARNADR